MPRPALRQILPDSQNRRANPSHRTKNQAAICDPSGSLYLAALGPPFMVTESNPTALSRSYKVLVAAEERECISKWRVKGSRLGGPARVESAADVLASLTGVTSAIERGWEAPSERRP